VGGGRRAARPTASRGGAVSAAAPLPAPERWPDLWRGLAPPARGLIGVRVLRSVGQGMLTVDWTLFLRASGWTAAQIGLLLAVEGLAGAGLMLILGYLSDRHGRRPFLLGYQALVVAGTSAILVLRGPWVLAAAAVLLGLGRGANGAAGPFAPIEQSWLSRIVPRPLRGRVFSLNNAGAFLGMGAGAVLAGALSLVAPGGGPAAFWPVFAVVGAVGMANAVQLRRLPDPPAAPAPEDPAPDAAASAPVAAAAHRRRLENRALAKLLAVNAVNALAIGIVGPLVPYWFAVRFGVGPEVIGPVYAATFFATALASVVTGELTGRLGIVRAVVLTRVAGVACMAALPLSPAYGVAAALYAVRSMANRGSAGARSALGVNLVSGERRGLAASLNGLSMRLPSSVGPALGGWLFSLGSLEVPFFLAAALQLVFLVLFGVVLKDVERQTATAA
jgi:MFS family permease